MATNRTLNFTKAALDAIKAPDDGVRLVVRDAKTQGLELRITSRGAKTFSLRRRVKGGKVERVTIGSYPAVSIEVARDKAKVVTGQQAVGVSHASIARKKRQDGLTFTKALQAFVDDDSTRDAPMKPRTRLDYLNMIRAAGKSESGHRHGAGELHALADKRIDALTGALLKAHFKKLTLKSPTRAAYAMRVARAVLNYHGVRMEDDPFDRATAKRDRIVLPAANKRTRTIPFERLRDWWHAASEVQSGDAFQLLLLSGMRRGELASLRRDDADLNGARLHLSDTKNRRPHVIMLSKQALEIVRARAANKAGDDLLFAGAGDPRKSLQAIIAATGVPFSAHDCRRTFGTIAASHLPGYVVKRLMNHADGNDVTGAHYVHLDEATLRRGWQVVADIIVGANETVRSTNGEQGNVVSLKSRRGGAQ